MPAGGCSLWFVGTMEKSVEELSLFRATGLIPARFDSADHLLIFFELHTVRALLQDDVDVVGKGVGEVIHRVGRRVEGGKLRALELAIDFSRLLPGGLRAASASPRCT